MKRITLLLTSALIFVLVASVGAQDGAFGLSAEELQAWGAANTASGAKEQFAFTYNVSLDFNSGADSGNVVLSGKGAVDVPNSQANLTVNGNATMGADSAVLEGEVRLVGEMLYGRATDPTSGNDTGWFSVNAEELAASNIDMDALGEELTGAFMGGFAEGAGVNADALNPDDFTGALFAAMAVDPSQFVFLSSSDNGDGSKTFTAEVSLSQMAETDGVDAVLAELLRASQIEPELQNSDVTVVMPIISSALADTIISADQTVNGMGLIQQASILISSTISPADFGESGDPVTVVFTLAVDVFNYDTAANLTAPEAAIEIPASMIANELGTTAGATAPSGGSDMQPMGVDGGPIAVGQTSTVTIPAGGSTASLSLTANEPVLITARSVDGTLDTKVTVYDAAGTEIAYNDDHGTFEGLSPLDSGLDNVIVNGAARIEISEWGTAGGNVEVSVMPAGSIASTSVNEDAGAIAVGQTITASVPSGGSTASLSLTANGPVMITVRSVTGALDPKLTVYDANGTQIGYNDDHDGMAGLGILDAGLASVTVNGTARIEIGEWSTGGGDVEVSVMPVGGGAAAAPSGGPSGGMAGATPVSLTCFSTAREFGETTGDAFSGTCPANCNATVWGTGTYTDDSSVCTAAVHSGVIPATGGAVTFVMADGQDSYNGTAANGITTLDYGYWGGSFTFGSGGAAAAPSGGPSGGAAPATVNTAGLDASGVFPSGISYSYPSSYTESSANELLVMLQSSSGMGFVQIFDMTSIFGDMDMGKEFFQDTYGDSAATTWGFTYDRANYQDVTVNGRELSQLTFSGVQNGSPVTGSVVIVPLTRGGYSYITAYSLSPNDTTLNDDALAIASTLDG